MNNMSPLLNGLAVSILLGFTVLVIVVTIRFFVDHLKLDRFRNNLKTGDECLLYVGGGEYTNATILENYEDGDACISSQYGQIVVSKNKIYPII
jgi:hypothetical protein